MRVLAAAALAVATFVAAPAATLPAFAQGTVTAADIQRLQDNIYDLGGDLSRLRSSNPQRAEQLQNTLDDLRDEVIYLRVRLRKEQTVPRAEYTDVRNRIDDLRSELRNDRSSRSSTATESSSTRSGTTTGISTDEGSSSGRSTSDRSSTASTNRRTTGSGSSVIPAGQELDARLQDTLSSDRNQVEDRFIATTVVDLQVDDRVVIPAGSELRGVVSSVNPAGRIERKGSMTVSFDQITIGGRTYPIRGTVTQALESEGVRGEAGRIGAGAGVGAIIGGILGGFKGALAGILIGGGGVIAATEGRDVELPAGTILRVRLDSPPELSR
jgi:TolA-binding protein